jgi:hypothetical protein
MSVTKNLATEAYGEFERLFRDYPTSVKGVIPELVLQHDGQVYSLLFNRSSSSYTINRFDKKIGFVGVGEQGLCRFFTPTEVPSGEQAEFEKLLPRYVEVLKEGVPQPRQGSLFGYVCDGRIQLLVQAWVEKDEACWQFVASEEYSVPDFLDPKLLSATNLDHRFWDEYRVGNIVVLDELIANAPKGSVLWVKDDEYTYQLVCRPIGMVEEGVYSTVDMDGERRPSPTLVELLARLDQLEVIDIGPRMRKHLESVGVVSTLA